MITATTAAETATAPEVLVEIRDRVKTITINRPQKKNALNHSTELALLQEIRRSVDDDSRVIILTGAGGDFCAGADLGSPGSKQYDVTTHLKEDVHPIVSTMRGCNKPFIAKVRGACVGVGCNIALGCDMIFASETAYFSQIFVKVGLATDGGGSYFMARAMGYPKAFEMITAGAKIPSADAERLNLINRVIEGAELDGEVDGVANRLATGPFVAIQRCKANLREAMDGTIQSTLDLEADSQGYCFKSRDFAEGVLSFLQKRKPAYKGE